MFLMSMIFFFIISVGLAILVTYQYQKYRDIEKKMAYLAKKNFAFEQEIKALLNADIAFGRSIAFFKEQINALDDRQAQIENRRSNDGGYQHALKLLGMGSSVEEIIHDCNLSPAEAELLANLQAYQMASNGSFK